LVNNTVKSRFSGEKTAPSAVSFPPRLSRHIGCFREFPKSARIGNSFLVLLGCPFGRYDLGTTLGDNVFKMADLEVPSIARAAERPFHQAFQQKKLPCPHSQCMNENCFYLPDGLDHHFRTIHGRPSTMRDVEEAKTLLRVKHSAETLAWIRKTSEMAVRFESFTFSETD